MLFNLDTSEKYNFILDIINSLLKDLEHFKKTKEHQNIK